MAAWLRNAVSLLSAQAEMFWPRYFCEFSNAEIAEALLTSGEAIDVALHKARVSIASMQSGTNLLSKEYRSMNDLTNRSTDDHSEEHLNRVRGVVLSCLMPADAGQRAVDAAVSWETASVVSVPLPNRRRGIVMVASGIAIAVLVVGILLSRPGPTNQFDRVSSDKEVKSESTTQAPMTFYQHISMTRPVMAEAAPIIACIGPEKPTKLGAVVAHAIINKGLDAKVVRLHVWDWSKSDISRILLVQRSQLGVLSPDGTTMLTNDGEAINLESRKTHQYAGFRIADGQRMSEVRFSPSRKYVAAMIHLRTQIDKVQADPPLFGATHWWSLRILELKTERRIGEFPAYAHTGVAFSPDETSFIYSSEEHRIIRRDLASGKILNEYQPPLGIHGAVGITVSPDGRFVAAGQDHGKIYIWDMESGKRIVEHQFLRDNGEKDTFFQAKVLRFAPNAELLAMVSGNRLKVMETKTGKTIKQHYHETTPVFVHLQWSQDAKKITLLTYSEPTQYADADRFPARPTADVLPRVYEWEWQVGDPRLKQFP